jgi:dTDP-4-amino-4,6-dideoxygalactose transaminase
VDYAGIRAVVEGGRAQFRPANPNQAQLGRPLFFADAAHSFGAQYGGRPVAEQADFTAFSFHAVKNFTTAEGGAVVCALPEGFDRAEVMRWMKVWGLHGATRDALAKARGGQWEYDVVGAGFKCNMTDLQAAIGRAQLPKYPAQLNRRAELAARYDAELRNLPGAQLPPRQDAQRRSAFHLYGLHLHGLDLGQRNVLIERLREDGIPTNVHFIPLARLTVHRDRGLRITDFPVAERHFKSALSLPLHTDLTEAQQDWVVERLTHHVRTLQG